jgi:hypothetical protein
MWSIRLDQKDMYNADEMGAMEEMLLDTTLEDFDGSEESDSESVVGDSQDGSETHSSTSSSSLSSSPINPSRVTSHVVALRKLIYAAMWEGANCHASDLHCSSSATDTDESASSTMSLLSEYLQSHVTQYNEVLVQVSRGDCNR